MEQIISEKQLHCVGDTVFYPQRDADRVVVKDDAVITQIPASGEGFFFQFGDEIEADYEVHHFMPWKNVGTIAFFSEVELQKNIANQSRATVASDACKQCFTGLYRECSRCCLEENK